MEEYRVKKVNEIKQTSITVHVPGSKSITNRALLLATLAKGESALSGVLFSDDSRHFLDCVQKLGIETKVEEDNCNVTVNGHGDINSLSTEDTPFLTELEKWALKERVPIIRKETQSFLKMLLVMKQPEHILEIGTAVGFSSLMMSECVSENCTITTIENYEKRIPIARENFVRAGKVIRLHFSRVTPWKC